MIFAALSGSKADGMGYAMDAAARGAAIILTGLESDSSGISVPVLRAGEPRRALALLAARFYGKQPSIAAAITGTNGKTSTAAFLRQIWAATGHEAASIGTIGIVTNKSEMPVSHTTPDPVSLHRNLAKLAADGVTHVALEASSHGLAQYRLDGVRLAAGAFTNITRDHLDYHSTFEDYLSAKLRLLRELLKPGQPAVIDADGAGSEAAIDAARARKLEVITAGINGEAIKLASVERNGFKQKLSIRYGGRDFAVELPLAGTFQVSNALVAVGLALSLGGSPDAAFQALGGLGGAKGRLEYVGETEAGAPLFVDYAHTPDALVKALQALRPYASARLVVVFGCGGDRDKGKRPEMGAAAAAHADLIYVTDDNPRTEEPALIRRAILAGAPRAIEIAGRGDAIMIAVENLKGGDVLLIAGKGHETGQIVGSTVIPYSDHDAAATALARLKTSARSSASHV
jgi:UDP-N-acetylmuramoyl-L-alanyl-D-glutamate--2,6-diaminopimelate ligase